MAEIHNEIGDRFAHLTQEELLAFEIDLIRFNGRVLAASMEAGGRHSRPVQQTRPPFVGAHDQEVCSGFSESISSDSTVLLIGIIESCLDDFTSRLSQTQIIDKPHERIRTHVGIIISDRRCCGYVVPTTVGVLGVGRFASCPRAESNCRTRFRKPMLYPLSYGGVTIFEVIGNLTRGAWFRCLG